MARKGNILSFEEAKKAEKPRLSVSAAKSGGKPTKRNSQKTAGRPSADTARPKLKTANHRAAANPKNTPSVSGTTRPASARRQSGTPEGTRNSATAPSPRRSPAARKSDSRPLPAVKAAAARNQGGRAGKRSVTDNDESAANRGGKESRLSALKREHSKSKAGKAFTRQFGDTTASAADSGPRAALYKGEMGRSHKRATNMQNTGSQKKINGRAVFSLTAFDWKGSPRKSAGIMVAACLVLSCLFLYSPAQQYYSAVRQNQQAQAEYAALVERNENIQSSVETLTSSEGIEDRARKELGWVKEGENAVTVYGVASENNPSSYVKSIPAGSVEAPNSWYTPVLDFLFGVQ